MINQQYIDGLLQDCSNSIANALELLQSCTKPSILWTYLATHYENQYQQYSICGSLPNVVQDGYCWLEPNCGVNSLKPGDEYLWQGSESALFQVDCSVWSHYLHQRWLLSIKPLLTNFREICITLQWRHNERDGATGVSIVWFAVWLAALAFSAMLFILVG